MGIANMALITVSTCGNLKDIGIIKGIIEGTRIKYCINPVRRTAINDQTNEVFNQLKSPATGEDCC